jgi:uncharacterized protein YutE (UPF0331/DUF86 family)
MEPNQQQLVQAYKQEFQAQGGQTPESDDQIVQKLKAQNITDPQRAKEAGKQAAQQSAREKER